MIIMFFFKVLFLKLSFSLVKNFPNFYQNIAFFPNPYALATVPKMGVRALYSMIWVNFSFKLLNLVFDHVLFKMNIFDLRRW